MSILKHLLGQRQKKTANKAKERLQIILAHERAERSTADFLPQLKEEILQVVSKYVPIERKNLQIQLDKAGDYEVLELNIVLTDQKKD